MKKILFLIFYSAFVNFSHAQDAKLIYNNYVTGKRNYDLSHDDFALIKFKQEAGKFPNFKKSSSLEQKIYKLYNRWMNESTLLSNITPKKYEDIVSLFAEWINCNEYNIRPYFQLTEFYRKLYHSSKDEKYLNELNQVYAKMKIKFAYKYDSLYNKKQGFQDEVYQTIIEDYFFLNRFQDCYNQCLEYQQSDTVFFQPVTENNICKNIDKLLLLPILNFKLGKLDESIKLLEKIKNDLESQNVDISNNEKFSYVYKIILFNSQNILTYHDHVFYNHINPGEDFVEKKIDFINSKDLLPINNLSSKIIFQKTGRFYDYFLKGGTNNNKLLWPVFAPLNLENTPDLLTYLNGNEDVVLMIKLGYIKNVIDIENIGNKTKIYFLENFDKKIIGIFDKPKTIDEFKNIKIDYYFFNYELKDSDVIDIYFSRLDNHRGDKNHVVIGQIIKNLTYSKVDISKYDQLQLPNNLNCEKIVQLKRKEEQVKRDNENARIAEQKRQDQVRIAQENSNNVSSNGTQAIAQHKEYIKNELYKVGGLAAMFGDSESDREFNIMVSSLEGKLNRTLNKQDYDYIKTVMNEVVAEQKFINNVDKSIENVTLVCKWCNKSYYAKNGWVVKDKCDMQSQTYMFGMYGYSNEFCSQKHLSEWLCANKGCKCH